MNTIKRLTAISLIICMLFGLWFGNARPVLGAISPVNVYISDYDYDDGELKITWDTVPNAKSAAVFINDSSAQVDETGLNYALISNLQSDIIYEIKVELYDQINASGNVIGQGLVYFMPQITFIATAVGQNYQDLVGGGREIGSKPRLNLKWKMPKIWTGTAYEYANDCLDYMQNKLNSIYNDGRQIGSINFRINLSNYQQDLSGDSSISSILIDYSGGEFIAYISGNTQTMSKVAFDSSSGYMSFELIGRESSKAELPPAEEYGLPNPDILPGTIYYMNIKPIFKNASQQIINVLRVGDPEDQNGSTLYGSFPYTYTPLRFKLSKDSLDNVYIKIYKLNQGSLDLPRLFYEIQVSDDPSLPGDWSVKKIIDDSYFAYGEDNAITVISGINPNNELYYKIVVKSESTTDRIESLSMPYIISQDKTRPPVPKGLSVVDTELVIRETVNEDGETVVEKSTDVTISWEKPNNWDEIIQNTDPNEEIYYNILLNTSQSDVISDTAPELEAEGKSYGNFPAIYRLVKYINAKSPNIKENGNRLEYTIKGFDLFKGEGADGVSDEDISNAENYPTFLLPNKVYYIRMYTTKGENNKGTRDSEHMSDESITISFTTKTSVEMEVSIPNNFRVNKNDIAVDSEGNLYNYIELQFDKVKIDWEKYTSNHTDKDKVYYDLYMSTSSDLSTFIPVGTTGDENSDVKFTGVDSDSTYIKALLDKFESQELRNRFGEGIRPNTIYYFLLRTRLHIDGKSPDKTSVFTTMLFVTTPKLEIIPPDESERKPLDPDDFAVASDEAGNLLVTGTSVTFEWTRKETDVVYEIIATSKLVPGDSDSSYYENDPVYESFRDYFGDEITIDPSDPDIKNFSYDGKTKICTLKIDEWLFPNRLYYFSIRAVNKDTGTASQWISIPVTTTLIESPVILEAVTDTELAFYWTDENLNLDPQNFRVYIKGADDKDFIMLGNTGYTIVKDDTVYYCRIYDLEPKTSYSVMVNKVTATQSGQTTETTIYKRTRIKTKDSDHEIEVRWKGNKNYKYEIAIKDEDDVDYTVLTSLDVEQYIDKDGKLQPYYIEKDERTKGTDYNWYYAKIKSIPQKAKNGSTQHIPLESNTKYYVKVRSIMVDPLDSSSIAYSKYVGPVVIRTEFNQEDYDRDEDEQDSIVKFLDSIEELDKSYYWRVGLGYDGSNKMLLKRDRLINILENNAGSPFVIDVFSIDTKNMMNVVYIPIDVISTLNAQYQSLLVKTAAAEFIIGPGMIDAENNSEIKEMYRNSSAKDILVKMTVNCDNSALRGLPRGGTLASWVNDVSFEVVALTDTCKEIEKDIYEYLYDSENGLVSKKLNEISEKYKLNMEDDIDEYIDGLVNEIKDEVSLYVESMLDLAGSVYNRTVGSESIAMLDGFMTAKLVPEKDSPTALPYYFNSTKGSWERVNNQILSDNVSLKFNILKTGKYALIDTGTYSENIYKNYGYSTKAIEIIDRFSLNSLSVLSNITSPESNATLEQVVAIYERVTGVNTSNSGLGLNERLKMRGLEKITVSGNKSRNITRQEAAYVLIKLYSARLGIDADSLKPSGNVFINDENKIKSSLVNYVELSVSLDILNYANGRTFNPDGAVSIGDMIEAIAKVIEITSD